jgi:DNA polymerase-3 subunit epsilon
LNFFLTRLRNRWLRARLKAKALHPLARTNLGALDHLNLSLTARSYRYVVVDLETTGLSLSHDRVVSVGAFRVVEGRVRLGDLFNELVNPGRNIPPSSIKIHGIVPDMVAEARPAWEVFDAFLAFLGVDILVAHHASFDLNFLNKVMRRSYGFPIQNLVLDTVPLCREIAFPPHRYPYGINLNQRRYGLDQVAKHFGIKIYQRHTSIGDALATAMVFQRILARLENGSSGILRDLVRAGGVF